MATRGAPSGPAPRPHRNAVGQRRSSITTPALILDLRVVRRNITAMANAMSGPTQLRPHAKSHKCAQVARMQIDSGAQGVTVATVWEAAALADAGIDDILVANEVVGWEKVRAAAETAKRVRRLTVAVDDDRNAMELSAAAASADTKIGVLIDIDTGMNRCGVRTSEDALNLADRLSRLPGLRLLGVMGYEGHCVLEKDRAVRAAKAAAAVGYVLGIVDRLIEADHTVEVVSAGGTGTWDMTGANPRITEIQAGSYVFMDTTREAIVPDFACGLTVLTTVVSRQGTTLVLDGGRKTVGVEFTLPRIAGEAGATATPRGAAEEHLLFDVTADCPLKVGDRVEVIPGYCPTTVNLHDVYYVAEGDTIVDIWPVLARGAGQPAAKTD